jgi:DNA-binding NarL/FixJ family response regulator
MIDVIVADKEELFLLGMTAILAVAGDVRVVGQPQSAEQLLSTLNTSTPHVLILSTSFLPVFDKIQPLLKRGGTALVVLADENDQVAYMRWLRAQAVVHRSMDGPVIVEVMRRVARGDLFVQDRSSDVRKS